MNVLQQLNMRFLSNFYHVCAQIEAFIKNNLPYAQFNNLQTVELFTMRLWHGTKHDISKFTLQPLGEAGGVGAQTEGYGIYFTDDILTAKGYQESLGGGVRYEINGTTLNPSHIETAPHHITEALQTLYKKQREGTNIPNDDELLDQLADSLLSSVQVDVDKSGKSIVSYSKDGAEERRVFDSVHEAIEFAQSPEARQEQTSKRNALQTVLDITRQPAAGHTYEVTLSAEPNDFMDWYRPVAEQSPKVQQALAQLPLMKKEERKAWTGQQIYEYMADYPGAVKTSETLKQAGIAGIKYSQELKKTRGKKSHLLDDPNYKPKTSYVVFDPSIVQIDAEATKVIASQSAQPLKNIHRSEIYDLSGATPDFGVSPYSVSSAALSKQHDEMLARVKGRRSSAPMNGAIPCPTNHPMQTPPHREHHRKPILRHNI